MVQLLHPITITAARTGGPVHTRKRNGDEHVSDVESTTLEHVGVSCRCCGVRLDRDAAVLRFDVYFRSTPERVRRPTSVTIHRDPCLALGFVQTIGFGGRDPNRIRFVALDGNIVDGVLSQRSRVVVDAVDLSMDGSYVPTLKQRLESTHVVAHVDNIRMMQEQGGNF